MTRSTFFALFASAAVLGSFGCRDEQAGPHPEARRGSPAARTASAQQHHQKLKPLTFRSGGSWDGRKLVYVGARVDPPFVKPGQEVEVTQYFAALSTPPEGYQLFMHVVDAKTGRMVLNLDRELNAGVGAPRSWPLRKLVQDVVRFKVPESQVDPLRVLVGFWQGNQRLPVDQARAQDGQNEMLGPPIGIQPTTLPTYVVHRTKHPPKIDGRLNDPAWKKAEAVTLVGSFDGRPTVEKTTARLLWDDSALYVAFDCVDPDVWGTMMKRDQPIYTQETVEIFLDANADQKTYDELEVSPNDTIFDAYFPARRTDMDLGWTSGMTAAVRVNGTLNNPKDEDQGWTVEMRIPYAHLAEVPHVPPKKGDRWRFNLYRLEFLNRTTSKHPHASGQAFSPLFQGDFHNLPRFGWLQFAQ